jgi:hypothetical protein
VLHTDRLSPARRQEIQAALPQAAELTLARTFGADQVYQLQAHSFDPGQLEVRGYLPPRAAAGQPYTAYIIAVNRGQRSYAVSPTDLVQPTAVWQDGTVETASPAQANLPLVTSPEGGVAVIPVQLTGPAQAGSYRLTLGESGGPLGEWGVEGMVTVGTQGDNSFPVPAQLAGWATPAAVRAGQPLSVDLTWRALGKIDAYYSVYVKLLDAAGNAVAGWDGQPRNGEAPTLLWVPGETIDDRVTLIVPPETPPGDYTVEVGMYRAGDLARALTLNAGGVPVDRVEIGRVRVGP